MVQKNILEKTNVKVLIFFVEVLNPSHVLQTRLSKNATLSLLSHRPATQSGHVHTATVSEWSKLFTRIEHPLKIVLERFAKRVWFSKYSS